MASWSPPITRKATGLQYSWSPVPRPRFHQLLSQSTQQPSGDGGGAGSNSKNRILGYRPDACSAWRGVRTGNKSDRQPEQPQHPPAVVTRGNGQISQSIFAKYFQAINGSWHRVPPVTTCRDRLVETDFMIMMWKAATTVSAHVLRPHRRGVRGKFFVPTALLWLPAGDAKILWKYGWSHRKIIR